MAKLQRFGALALMLGLAPMCAGSCAAAAPEAGDAECEAAEDEVQLAQLRATVKRHIAAEDQATREDSSDFDKPNLFGYMSQAQRMCKSRLLEDPGCCLDKKKEDPTVVKTTNVSRPGTAWNCTMPYCTDTTQGPRGKDGLWWPTGADCSSPRILYVHGGSWEAGSPFTNGYDALCSKLAHLTGAFILSIDYPLATVGNYSWIMQAGLDAFEWLAVHGPGGQECPRDANAPALFIGGDSSGGGSAWSLLLHTQSRPDLRNMVAGAFMYSPWVNLMCNTSTYWTNAFSKIPNFPPEDANEDNTDDVAAVRGDLLFNGLPWNMSDEFRQNAMNYTQDKTLLTDPVASPYFAGGDLLRDLPPMYMTVGAPELLNGEVAIVGERALQNGVPMFVDIYGNMWHDFQMYSEGCGAADSTLWQGVQALNRTGEFVKVANAFWKKHGREDKSSGGGIQSFYSNDDDSGPMNPPQPINLSLKTNLIPDHGDKGQGKGGYSGRTSTFGSY